MKAALPMALVVAPIGATAETCITKEQAEAGLDRYGETPKWFGLSGDGVVFQLYDNPETGTWTLLAISPDGKVCVIGYGDVSTPIPAEPQGEDS